MVMIDIIIGIVLGVVFNSTWLMLWKFFKTTSVYAKLIGFFSKTPTPPAPPAGQ
jgi:hypothetical protein